MKIALFSSCLLVFPALSAAEVTIPLTTYAPDSGFDGVDGSVAVDLPDGWTYSEHQGNHYVIGGSDVYGTLSLAYSELGVMNFSSQFGTPNPPVSQVGKAEVYYLVKDTGASFLRKLGGGWSLRASLLSYPAFEGKDLTSYSEAMIQFLGKATVTLPDSEMVGAAEGAIVFELDGDTFTFKPEGDVWSGEGSTLMHKSGASFVASRHFDNQGLSQLNVFQEATGLEGEIWEQLSMPPVIGKIEGGKMFAFAQIRRDEQGDAYVLLTGEANESLKEDLVTFLTSRVTD